MGSDLAREAVTAFRVRLINGGRWASRSLFIIDRKGVIRYANYSYRIGPDYDDVIATLEEIAADPPHSGRPVRP